MDLRLWEWDRIVAIVLDTDGRVIDGVYAWQTAETVAMEGHTVIATRGDGPYSREALQELVDARLEWHRDCFAALGT